MRELSVPRLYLEQLFQEAEKAGCQQDKILSDLHLSKSELESKSHIPAQQYGQIYRQVMLTTQNEWFGFFSGGERVPLGSFRMMGLTLLHCDSLRQAIGRASDFAEICRGMNTRYELETIDDSTVKLRLEPIRSVPKARFKKMLGEARSEALIGALLTWHRFSEWLIDKDINIRSINLMASSDGSISSLVHANIKNICFNQPEVSMTFDSRFLDHPIVQSSDSLHNFLRTAPYHLVTQDPAHTSPAEKVRSLINKDVGHSMPTTEEVASKLNVSITTLRRQLQREDTSFQKLKDECRLEAALHYLSYRELSNTDIAQKLGFDEPSAFFRSFKKWTGMTPGEYRAKKDA